MHHPYNWQRVFGNTTSANFPTVNPLQPALGGNYDAFVAKLNPSGSALVYSTYFGGSGNDTGYGIASDSVGNAYVTGTTYSTNFPTVNPLQPALSGTTDAFVAKILQAHATTFALHRCTVRDCGAGRSGSRPGSTIAGRSDGCSAARGARASPARERCES
jgi:Beta-propeller repeat